MTSEIANGSRKLLGVTAAKESLQHVAKEAMVK